MSEADIRAMRRLTKMCLMPSPPVEPDQKSYRCTKIGAHTVHSCVDTGTGEVYAEWPVK